MPDFSGLGRLLLIGGLGLAAAGLLLIFLPHAPWGRLPGDLLWRRGPVTVYIPLATSLLLSLLLTLLLNLMARR